MNIKSGIVIPYGVFEGRDQQKNARAEGRLVQNGQYHDVFLMISEKQTKRSAFTYAETNRDRVCLKT